MSIVKTFRYPVSIEWWGNGLMSAHAADKSALRVAAPRDLGGSYPNYWSPEELLVNAVGTCYAITLRSVMARMGVPLHELEVEATGHLEHVQDGGYRFFIVELDVAVETHPEKVKAAERAAEVAERRCIVSGALAVPVHVRLAVRTGLRDEVSV